MIRAVVILIIAVLLAAVTLLTVLLVGMRTRTPIVVDAVRRASRDRFNPRQMESAGSPGAYAAVIEHTGRVSGRRRRTPIVAWSITEAGDWVPARERRVLAFLGVDSCLKLTV